MVCACRIWVKFFALLLIYYFCYYSYLIAFCCCCFQKLLDRFDYDDEPEGGEETKRDETSSIQPALYAMA